MRERGRGPSSFDGGQDPRFGLPQPEDATFSGVDDDALAELSAGLAHDQVQTRRSLIGGVEVAGPQQHAGVVGEGKRMVDMGTIVAGGCDSASHQEGGPVPAAGEREVEALRGDPGGLAELTAEGADGHVGRVGGLGDDVGDR